MADFLAGYLGKQALRSKPDMPVTLQSTMTLESKGSGPSSGHTRGWNDDAHFLCAAALAMRHVLVNHAHARIAAKRGAGAQHLPLEAADYVADEQDDMLVNLNEALAKLAAEAPRLAQVVECRYFGGFDDSSTARALQLSERTVRRDWVLARAWLHRELRLPGDASALSC